MGLFNTTSKTMWYIKYAFLGLVFGVVAYSLNKQILDNLPDAGLTTEEQVRKHGYPLENHFVTTEDGYILRAHRIPHGKKNVSANTRVVLLMPGIWRSSEVWVNFGPRRSLGFILADSGYDVWLGNYRGTTWSRKHLMLDPDQEPKQFWNFSVDELGYYDCPAFVDYILQTTGQSSIIYIGETLGATMFFIMGAEKPQYIDKVKLMVSIAPMIDLGKPSTLLYPTVVRFQKEMQMFADYFETYEILRRTKWSSKLGILACGNMFLQDICRIIHSLGVGFNDPQLNRTAIPLLLNGFPAGSSLKELIHLSQVYQTGVFAKYDYGPKENLKHYGQKSPPVYDFSKITTPISLYYGENDAFVDKKGVERFAAKINNLVSKKFMKGFSNGDFLWAKDVVKLVYKGMLQLMQTY